jgi:hypothetical protein
MNAGLYPMFALQRCLAPTPAPTLGFLTSRVRGGRSRSQIITRSSWRCGFATAPRAVTVDSIGLEVGRRCVALRQRSPLGGGLNVGGSW